MDSGVEKTRNSLTVKDSLFGLPAARSFRMTAMGFTSSFCTARLRAAGAHHTIASYRDFPDLMVSLAS